MKKLFKDLMNLVKDDDTKFFSKDVKNALGQTFRVFSYHVASYNDWLKPGAIECRGIMFEIDEKGKPIRIAARPMQKFFNLGENPLTMNLDLSEIMFYMTKEDGSLISSYSDQGYLFLKSKTSLESDQVYQASAWLNKDEQAKFRRAILELAEAGFTVNMEWVSPDNRIVLGYPDEKLVVLNVRENASGDYMSPQEIRKISGFVGHVVEMFEAPENPELWVTGTRASEGIEGFVAVLPTTMFKLKTDWYCSLHHTKDSINSSRRLWACCAENATDDLRQMFEADPVSLARITEFDELYAKAFGESLKIIRDFYDANRGQDRKSFAVAGQVLTKELDKRHLFGLIMKTYDGFNSDYIVGGIKDVLTKYWELYVSEPDA